MFPFLYVVFVCVCVCVTLFSSCVVILLFDKGAPQPRHRQGAAAHSFTTLHIFFRLKNKYHVGTLSLSLALASLAPRLSFPLLITRTDTHRTLIIHNRAQLSRTTINTLLFCCCFVSMAIKRDTFFFFSLVARCLAWLEFLHITQKRYRISFIVTRTHYCCCFVHKWCRYTLLSFLLLLLFNTHTNKNTHAGTRAHTHTLPH